MSASQTYNLLHLRAEEDWISHCARWGRIRDGELPPSIECLLRCVSCVPWHHLNGLAAVLPIHLFPRCGARQLHEQHGNCRRPAPVAQRRSAGAIPAALHL